jgi:hypothetical protein
MFTARYALSPCIKQISFVFKGLILLKFSSLSWVANYIAVAWPGVAHKDVDIITRTFNVTGNKR